MAEGFGVSVDYSVLVGCHPHAGCRHAFSAGWDSINAARGHGWGQNDIVLATEFRKVD
jgi:hypothetical protein